MKTPAETRIGVLGLGYVGLPLAVALATKYPTVGYDVNSSRVAALNLNEDATLEMREEELAESALMVTHDLDEIRSCNFYVITAPTPVTAEKQPDLSPLLGATRSVAQVLKKGDTVVYESTVYPGATEEECVPLLEELSGLKCNEDFWVGYSPERINPGDKEHRVTDILKITSGSTPEAAEYIDGIYSSIIRAGTHKAPTIKVAEAAKVIENTQRDVNIALMNELAILFNKLGIVTSDVLEAAGTKWNFLPFRPGLVGGHCIGVDPYYLTFKAQSVGYHPEIINAGRRLNDSMGVYVASQMIKEMAKQGVPIQGSRVLVLGLTFKENTPDLRNTRVIDVIRELEDYGVRVDVADSMASAEEAKREYGIDLLESANPAEYDACLLAVPHEGAEAIVEFVGDEQGRPLVFDLKSTLPVSESNWRL